MYKTVHDSGNTTWGKKGRKRQSNFDRKKIICRGLCIKRYTSCGYHHLREEQTSETVFSTFLYKTVDELGETHLREKEKSENAFSTFDRVGNYFLYKTVPEVRHFSDY